MFDSCVDVLSAWIALFNFIVCGTMFSVAAYAKILKKGTVTVHFAYNISGWDIRPKTLLNISDAHDHLVEVIRQAR